MRAWSRDSIDAVFMFIFLMPIPHVDSNNVINLQVCYFGWGLSSNGFTQEERPDLRGAWRTVAQFKVRMNS